MEDVVGLPSFKNERFSENIRREISYLMARKLKNLKDKACNFSVSRVEILAGGRLVKIYVNSIKGFVEAMFAVKQLNSASGFIKREISNSLKLRKCPEIDFVADDFVCVHERIGRVFQKING